MFPRQTGQTIMKPNANCKYKQKANISRFNDLTYITKVGWMVAAVVLFIPLDSGIDFGLIDTLTIHIE